MDDDFIDTDDDIFNDERPLSPVLQPSTYENISDSIQSFHQYFQRRCGNCPVLFMGTLQDACQVAFISDMIKEHHPVLVYIHDDETLLSQIFCQNIFCSERISDYLNDNYIVWPWDISFESNRKILTEMWKELFSIQFFDYFSIGQCPLLIGIQQTSPDNIDELLISKYHFKVLFQHDIILRTQQKVNVEILLDELHVFKIECDKNEEVLSFDFVQSSGLCPKIIVKLAKYLSLNDAIKAFSPSIIPLLNNSELKFQLSNPSDAFLQMVSQRFPSEQIVSLKLHGDQVWSTINLIYLTNIISITLLNLPYDKQINEYLKNLPNLKHLSLRYDYEIDFKMFREIFVQFSNRIKRLEIHSAGIFCPHYDVTQYNKKYPKNNNIKYFLLDIGLIPLILTDGYYCYMSHQLCFPKIIIDFILNLCGVQYVRLIINEKDIEPLLEIYEWDNVLNTCFQLKKITFEVLAGNSCRIQELIEKVSTIQTLNHIRQRVKLQIISSSND